MKFVIVYMLSALFVCEVFGTCDPNGADSGPERDFVIDTVWQSHNRDAQEDCGMLCHRKCELAKKRVEKNIPATAHLDYAHCERLQGSAYACRCKIWWYCPTW